jgi:rhodanese-related sulfurtransferase
MIFRTVWQSALLVALAAIAAAAAKAWHPYAPSLYLQNEPLAQNEIKLEEALTWDPPPLWVDARQPDKFAAGHIPGAIHIYPQEMDNGVFENIEALQDAQINEQRIVVYCGSHACKASKQVADSLRQKIGLETVYFLRSGWDAWVENQGKK